MPGLVCSLVATLALGLTGVAEASSWEIHPAHTSTQFAVRHLTVSTVRGTMAPVTGVLNLDEADIAKSSVESTIDVDGIDTREPKRDAHLKGPDFFDVAKYPTLTFKSQKLTPPAATKFQVTGDLTIHGVTKEGVLDVGGPTNAVQRSDGHAPLGRHGHD